MVPVSLSPKPGFCIKSTTLSPAVFYPPASRSEQHNKKTNLLEVPAPVDPVVVPQNRKVFVNIAWDTNVPPPPEGTEEAIQNAMQGDEEIDEDNPNGWFVPVIVSNAKADKDKAGNPCLVYDCVFNSSVRARTLRDPEFKAFLIELALQRIEAQNGISLSRTIATPNIVSKGKLLPRTVQIPATMLSPSSNLKNESPVSKNIASTPSNSDPTNQPLIQEISTTRTKANSSNSTPIGKSGSTSTSLPGLRGILKQSSAAVSPTKPIDCDEPLSWTWSKIDSDPGRSRIKVEVQVPGLTIPLVSSSSLDISICTLDLIIPNRRPLHIDLSLSDAEIAARVGAAYSSGNKAKSDEDLQRRRELKQEETNRVLQLKRQRDLDVEGAEAEWRVDSAVIVIYV